MQIKRLSEIAPRFDGMLIDQFGVIHDGEELYPGTLEVLENLHRLKIPVGIMTNSGKRSLANRQRLLRLGVPRNHFINVISSGEVAYHMLGKKKAFLIGKAGEDYGFEGVPFVSNMAQADIIVILGSDAPNTTSGTRAAGTRARGERALVLRLDRRRTRDSGSRSAAIPPQVPRRPRPTGARRPGSRPTVRGCRMRRGGSGNEALLGG